MTPGLLSLNAIAFLKVSVQPTGAFLRKETADKNLFSEDALESGQREKSLKVGKQCHAWTRPQRLAEVV